ncbi:MAG: glycosyltransferase [Armatimonadota bacterium]|nr:glycosyltransferase [Armatimonadota bacterium]MDR7400607.1 glycosyltransferase [Armatimonadota bacterium]MDR7403135.1 glycosyltransferase [Armatimonadota bacterium]MDR7517237.1 glycosyltransferase [Armatimonadota bacterium]MDR7559794.1 glycosyltransferase [Armatimonadota bacterium]
MAARLSVLIATKDRPDDLEDCLRSIAAQDRRPLDVVIVDQGRQGVAEVAARILTPAGIVLRYSFRPDLPGLTHARNYAVALAEGDILLFLDDDVVLEEGYCRAILAVFEADAAGRIGGASGLITNMAGSMSPLQLLRSRLFYRGPFSIERDAVDFHLRPSPGPRPALRLYGGNMAFRREIFTRLRFDEEYTGYSFGEDRDFSVAVARHYELRWVPDARLLHKRTPVSRIDRERFCELRVLSWLHFYERYVPKSALNRLAFLWLNLGFATLLAKVWDWPTARGTARGLVRVMRTWRHQQRAMQSLVGDWRPR